MHGWGWRRAGRQRPIRCPRCGRPGSPRPATAVRAAQERREVGVLTELGPVASHHDTEPLDFPRRGVEAAHLGTELLRLSRGGRLEDRRPASGRRTLRPCATSSNARPRGTTARPPRTLPATTGSGSWARSSRRAAAGGPEEQVLRPCAGLDGSTHVGDRYERPSRGVCPTPRLHRHYPIHPACRLSRSPGRRPSPGSRHLGCSRLPPGHPSGAVRPPPATGRLGRPRAGPRTLSWWARSRAV